MQNIVAETQNDVTVYKKWFFLLGGMFFVFLIYFVYSNMYGSNRYFDEVQDASNDFVQTAISTPRSTSEEIAPSAYLGVEIIDIDEVLAENLGLKGKTGVLVNEVISDSPADEAGLKRGDVIAAFNNRDTVDVANFSKLIAGTEPADMVRIVYVRDGKKSSTYASLVQNPSIVKTANLADESPQDWGVSLYQLTDEMRRAFDVPDDISGLMILSIVPGGAADQAGLIVGDVITGLDGAPISDMTDFFQALLQNEDDISLLDVYSNGRLRYVPINSASIQTVEQVEEETSTFLEKAIFFLRRYSPFYGEVDFDKQHSYTQSDLLPTVWYRRLTQSILCTGIAGFIFAGFLYFSVSSYPAGNKKMRSIAEKIRSGAIVFLRQEYRKIFIFMLITFFVLSIFFGISLGLAFIAGALCSMFAGWIGIKAVTSANVRTAQGAKGGGIWRALNIAFQGGAVMGITVAALGIVGLSSICLLTECNVETMAFTTVGFAMGTSIVALFTRVGGGIFTKSADIGADLVGKFEVGLPEDDPRNPGVIADNVGDCVGDTAGMGADLFESYTGSVIATIAIGATRPDCLVCIFLPLLLISIGLISSAIAVFSMRFLKNINPQSILRSASYIAGVLFLIGAYLSVKILFSELNLFWVILTGMLCGIFMGLESEYFTSGAPIESIAHSSESGSANTIITGFSVGLKSAILPIVTICATIFISYKLAGPYGIALSAVAMLSTVGIVVSADSYGSIADNAGGIAQMSGLGADVRDITDELDSLGNTTAAIGKGFAIGSAAMTAVAFFSAYLSAVGLTMLNLVSLNTGIGLLIGAVVPFAIAALTIESVSRIANRMVMEIRRQFSSIKGLLEAKAEPDVDRCIEIVARGSLEEIILPGFIAFGLPLFIGFVMGKEALGGFLVGATVTGVILSLVMTNAGAAWDNAKKWIERGHLGGKGSSAHRASVIGDTVGDPFKDTSGPAMNIIIKLMAVVSLVFAPLIKLL